VRVREVVGARLLGELPWQQRRMPAVGALGQHAVGAVQSPLGARVQAEVERLGKILGECRPARKG